MLPACQISTLARGNDCEMLSRADSLRERELLVVCFMVRSFMLKQTKLKDLFNKAQVKHCSFWYVTGTFHQQTRLLSEKNVKGGKKRRFGLSIMERHHEWI